MGARKTTHNILHHERTSVCTVDVDDERSGVHSASNMRDESGSGDSAGGGDERACGDRSAGGGDDDDSLLISAPHGRKRGSTEVARARVCVCARVCVRVARVSLACARAPSVGRARVCARVGRARVCARVGCVPRARVRGEPRAYS